MAPFNGDTPRRELHPYLTITGNVLTSTSALVVALTMGDQRTVSAETRNWGTRPVSAATRRVHQRVAAFSHRRRSIDIYTIARAVSPSSYVGKVFPATMTAIIPWDPPEPVAALTRTSDPTPRKSPDGETTRTTKNSSPSAPSKPYWGMVSHRRGDGSVTSRGLHEIL